ncbi:hypothetical protein L6164_003164 [Bauhinia variegata]|uniref:Uncharacterized protein n=1 Tax=Bauhinia variegata TaxID=167791 RepID=A0ACB9Q2H0_BAUVA|nr:hypothetical protein L6164_003164 [Bauhinia variegata]
MVLKSASVECIEVLSQFEKVESGSKSTEVVFDLEGAKDEERDCVLAMKFFSTLTLTSLLNLKHIWNKDPQGILDFPQLTRLKLVDVPKQDYSFIKKAILNLELKILEVDKAIMTWFRQFLADRFNSLEGLGLQFLNDVNRSFPYSVLQKMSDLKYLMVKDALFKEIFPFKRQIVSEDDLLEFDLSEDTLLDLNTENKNEQLDESDRNYQFEGKGDSQKKREEMNIIEQSTTSYSENMEAHKKQKQGFEISISNFDSEKRLQEQHINFRESMGETTNIDDDKGLPLDILKEATSSLGRCSPISQPFSSIANAAVGFLVEEDDKESKRQDDKKDELENKNMNTIEHGTTSCAKSKDTNLQTCTNEGIGNQKVLEDRNVIERSTTSSESRGAHKTKTQGINISITNFDVTSKVVHNAIEVTNNVSIVSASKELQGTDRSSSISQSSSPIANVAKLPLERAQEESFDLEKETSEVDQMVQVQLGLENTENGDHANFPNVDPPVASLPLHSSEAMLPSSGGNEEYSSDVDTESKNEQPNESDRNHQFEAMEEDKESQREEEHKEHKEVKAEENMNIYVIEQSTTGCPESKGTNLQASIDEDFKLSALLSVTSQEYQTSVSTSKELQDVAQSSPIPLSLSSKANGADSLPLHSSEDMPLSTPEVYAQTRIKDTDVEASRAAITDTGDVPRQNKESTPRGQNEKHNAIDEGKEGTVHEGVLLGNSTEGVASCQGIVDIDVGTVASPSPRLRCYSIAFCFSFLALLGCYFLSAYWGYGIPLVSNSSPSSPVKDTVELNKGQISLLRDAFARYPNFGGPQKDFSPHFHDWAYKTLADLLHFLKTENPVTMTKEREKEFHMLCNEAIQFEFDKIWVEEMRKRVVKDPEVDHAQKCLMKILDKEQELRQEKETLNEFIQERRKKCFDFL